MNPHFFTAPFYFAFIWFRVVVAASPQYIWGDARKSLDSRLPSYHQPSPRGEGTPKGRIVHRRYERQRKKAERCAIHVRKA